MIIRNWYVCMNDRLRPFGLSVGQLPILIHLAEVSNVTQETLVRHIRIDKGAIARAARRLEDDGFIKREIDPADRRAVRLSLTAQGRNILPEIRHLEDEWEREICAGLAPDDVRTLRGLLARVAGNAAERGCGNE
jgi:DNA-binding MarR family transcriptional regulator